MTRRERSTWAGRDTDTMARAAPAVVENGYTRLENPTPCSLTAVGQRRDTTVATRTMTTGRGATTTVKGTTCTAALITVVRIPSKQ